MTKQLERTMGGTTVNNFMIGSIVNEMLQNDLNTSTTDGKNEEYYALDMRNIEIGEHYPLSPVGDPANHDYKEK